MRDKNNNDNTIPPDSVGIFPDGPDAQGVPMRSGFSITIKSTVLCTRRNVSFY